MTDQETVEIEKGALISLTRFAQDRVYETSNKEYRAYVKAAAALGWNET